MRRLLPIAAVTLCLAWAAPAAAYTVMQSQANGVELKWTSLPMKFNIHQGAPSGLTAAQWQAAIRAAYKSWSDVSCSYFSTQDLGVVNMPLPNGNDYVNTHVYRTSWPADFGSNALGITQTKYDPYSGKILDADVNYNPGYTWSVSGGAWDIDAQSVATHEIGHEMGLDHSQYQDATMFYATGAGDTSNRSLHSDDIAGVCYLFPSGQPAPPECSLPEHCAPNETCDNGSCVPAAAKGYGSPCSSSKDCESQLCLSDNQNNTFCSVMCDASNPCPNGDKCLPLQNGGSACLPGSANWGTKGLGEPCQTSQDCLDKMYCISVPGEGYLCASLCDVAKNDCPTGFTCTSSSIGGLCIPGGTTEPPPPPPPKAKLGESCTASVDCESGVCAQTNDGLVCVQWCDDSNPCPSGFKCVPAGTKKVCVSDGGTQPPAPGELGAPCTDHADCKSGICGADADGNRFCTVLCDPAKGCAEGFDCVPAGGDKYACSPSSGAGSDDGGGGGCAVADPEPPGPRWPLLILALPFLLLLRRRR